MTAWAFVDTWAWLALVDDEDRGHGAALETYRRLREGRVRCVTTNLVCYEALENLRRRKDAGVALAAERVITGIAAEPGVLEIIYVGPDSEPRAYDLLERFADQGLSVTDAFSFAVMQQLGLTTAFTGDWHFTLLGFEVIPDPKR